MKWLNGFYFDDEAPDGAVSITDEEYLTLLNGANSGQTIAPDAFGRLVLTGEAHETVAPDENAMRRMGQLDDWFMWYDSQVNQALRASRTGTAWSAVCPLSGQSVSSVTELDNMANAYQSELRELMRMPTEGTN